MFAKQAAIREGQDAVTSGALDVTNGVGPLHMAAANGHAALVDLLLQAGAPIDAPDGDGATAVQVTSHSSVLHRRSQHTEAVAHMERA